MNRRAICLILLVFFAVPWSASAEVHVYSARKEALLRPLLDAFTTETGIEVKLLAGKSPDLLRRLNLEKSRPVADVFIASDAGDLSRAAANGLLQAMPITDNTKAVDSAYRDPAMLWTGLSLRARTVVYAKKRVNAAALPANYLQLADRAWQGKICVRSSSSSYNQSLVAALLHHYDAAVVADWASGLVQNLARSPQGGDRDQIRAIAAGVCDLALVNTYYLGIMMHSADKADAAMAREMIAIHWPQQDAGVHVNLSGAGIVMGSEHAKDAATLIDYLLRIESQKALVQNNHEYPVRADVPLSETMRAWGEFKADKDAIIHLEDNRINAIQLMDRSGWR